MTTASLSRTLPVIQDAELDGRTVLVRFDHNVVKKGVIRDPFRIDRTFGTLYYIVERGGRPILMTHVGRPRDKKTGNITCSPDDSVDPIVEYLRNRLNTSLYIPTFTVSGQNGITGIDAAVMRPAIEDLKKRKISGIYLPNTRWFRGEEDRGFFRDNFAVQLSNLADIYVNDAFGSWQPHATTYDVTRYIPSYAGFLMQQEIANLGHVIDPERPFVSVVAGAKYDTKIGPLYAIYNKTDRLILGGVIYNTYLCAKYGISIKGIGEAEIASAKELVAMDEKQKKIVELQYIVESDIPGEKVEGRYRTISVRDFRKGNSYGYVLDVDPGSFRDRTVSETIASAKTIFVNAVMGYTPHFSAGSMTLDETIDKNTSALKMYGGGDTLQEFKSLCPGLYLSVLDNTKYYFFTGGGAVLTAIEKGSPYGLLPVQALIENKERAIKKP